MARSTVYVILQRKGDQDGFRVAGSIQAPTRKAALQRFYDGKNVGEDENFEAAAVPAQSWDPQPIAQEIQIKLVVG